MTELPNDPKDVDRETVRAVYESSENVPSDCWDNYGDANPAPHGGDWVHYDGDGWDYVSTFMAEEVGYPESWKDVDDPLNAQFVERGEVQWREVVTESGEWTDAARQTVESLHGAPPTPAAAVANDRLTWFIVAFSSERSQTDPYRDPVTTGDGYADILESVGVEPCDGEL